MRSGGLGFVGSPDPFLALGRTRVGALFPVPGLVQFEETLTFFLRRVAPLTGSLLEASTPFLATTSAQTSSTLGDDKGAAGAVGVGARVVSLEHPPPILGMPLIISRFTMPSCPSGSLCPRMNSKTLIDLTQNCKGGSAPPKAEEPRRKNQTKKNRSLRRPF
ncbi:hypothetical protein BHM03_00024021 [Ensete ventricosum]|nr:hypothetical protein BHM03_00024021 [Ensete ventricosum]